VKKGIKGKAENVTGKEEQEKEPGPALTLLPVVVIL
jgi:hypothetical protein